MLTRRAATTMLSGIAAAPSFAWAAGSGPAAVFYDAVGPKLTCWHADIANATLEPQGSITAPALIQYAWRHPTKLVLYVASSNFVPMGQPDGKHHLTAFRIDAANGALSPLGEPVAIRARPINITVDAAGHWLLTAYNLPSMMSVHPIQHDGGIGEEIKPVGADRRRHLCAPDPYDADKQRLRTGHARQQSNSGKTRRSRRPEGKGAEEGAGDRHCLDRARCRIWLRSTPCRLSSDEAVDVRLGGAPKSTKKVPPAWRQSGSSAVLTTLKEPGNLRPQQMVGPIHIHPNGHVVYVGNRASGTVERDGKKFAAGGENAVTAFMIDQSSGEPRPLQAIDTHGYHPRTFSIDPSGRMLVVANLQQMPVREGDNVTIQPATLSTYKIGADGRLTYVRSYDIETNDLTQWWSGFARL